jgi:NADH-quinone oxidoreductase subunit I
MIVPLIKGLQITFQHLFKKAVTLQYPEERPVVSPNFRGLHALKVSHNNAKCVACYLCPTVCPAKCITVEAGEDANHDKFAAKYEIDLLRCIFCGYCVEACPVDALAMTQVFELANYKRTDFVFTKERLLEKK